MAEPVCRHCGQRIVRTYIPPPFGTEWTHQPAGASFQDGQHTYCHRTYAEPKEETTYV